MFSTDFIFRQQENLVSGWIQAAMQQNTIPADYCMVVTDKKKGRFLRL